MLAVFPHPKKVYTHRLRITEAAQLDESIAALVQQAHDEVGPGTRSR